MDDVEWKLQQIGLRPMEVFFEAAKRGSFSEAARSLQISQPTVSNHIKKMEDILERPLFLRKDGRIRLTPLGRLFYRKLQSVDAARDELEQSLRTFLHQEQTTLKLGSSTIPGEMLLPRVLTQFRRQNPDVEVELVIADSRQIVGEVEKGNLRYGVIGSEPESSDVRYEQIFEDEMILVGSAEQFDRPPRKLDEHTLPQYPYVGRREGSGTQKAVESQIRRAGYDPEEVLNSVARLETAQAVREAVGEGLGVSFLPLCAVQNELKRGELIDLPTKFSSVHRSFYGIHNCFLELTSLLEHFRDLLKQHWHTERDRDGQG